MIALLLLLQDGELWRRSVESVSMGSAAVADLDGDGQPEVVFGTYFTKDAQAGSVIALHGKDGSTFWRFPVPRGPVDTSITIDHGHVYFGASGGNVYYCLDAKGKEVWRLETKNEVFDSPAAIADGLVFFGTCAYLKPKQLSGYLRALDAATGKEVWRAEFDGAVQAEPCLVDDKVFVTTWRGDRRIHALSAKTGERLWSFEFDGGEDIHGWGSYHGVAAGDGIVVGASYDKNVYAVDLAGKLRWKFACDEAVFAPVVLADCDGDGKLDALVCSEAGTYYAISEGKALWKRAGKTWRSKGARGFIVTDVTGDGKPEAVLVTQDAQVVALELATGKEVWSKAVDVPGTGAVECDSALVCDDFDGDGTNDLFLVAGRIADWKVGIEKSAKTCVAVALRTTGRGHAWPMFKRDLRHSGRLP